MRRDLEYTLIQRMLTQLIPLHLAQEKGHQVHEMVVASAVELIFKETAMVTSPPPREGDDKKGKQGQSWSKSAGKGKSKEGEGSYKGEQPLNDAWEARNWDGVCGTQWHLAAPGIKLTKESYI